MIRKFSFYTAILCIAAGFHIAAVQCAEDGSKEAAYAKVKAYVSSATPYKEVLSPEGEFIAVFNEEVSGWVKEKFDKALVKKIRSALAPYLRIDLTPRGFAPAAARALEGEKDTTNYDAIWVRDNVWVYYSLLRDPARREDAGKLLLALWDYYATDAQIARFENIITSPALAQDAMAMPHIRFDGKSPALDDVMAGGKPEVWNHRQIDAHGLFFTALGEAIEEGFVIAEDLTDKRLKVISLYPLFLKQIKFTSYEDAGAWEEIPRKNTSSIALATHSLQIWRRIMYSDNVALQPSRNRLNSFIEKTGKETKEAWAEASLNALIKDGLGTVRYQLTLGGESPDYKPDDIHFRLADAALVVLIEPSPLEGLSEEEIRRSLLIVETLKRPMGILRYLHDSYQAGNYWIEKPSAVGADAPALTGDTSSANAFLWRLGKLIPDTEAQWFFDSLIALARLHLAKITTDPKLREQDLHFAAVHLKRALGQVTGRAITSDGKAVKAWQSPESINTVVIEGRRYYLPSPITPLNWAKAALSMALMEYEKAAP
ncbi:MAG: hypothetical protein PHX20_04155 [Candidatus Omnitrophica bacterium]|nr:hypothetical protein [Candidatus Omnitrophota bacterium]